MFFTRQTSQTDSRRITDAHTPYHPHLQHQNAGSLSNARAYGCATADTHRRTNLSQNPRKLGEDGCSWQLRIVANVVIISTAALTKLKLTEMAPVVEFLLRQLLFGHGVSNLMLYQGIIYASVLNLEDITIQNWLSKARSWGHNMYTHRVHTYLHTVLSHY